MSAIELPPVPCLGVEAVIPTLVDDGGCVAVGLEAGARLGRSSPDVGVATTVGLTRTRLEAGLRRGPLGARLGTGVARSGGEEGYIGIDGESFVPVLRVAEASLHHPAWGLTLAAGAIDAAWVSTSDARWSLPALAPSLGELAGWTDATDLGGALTWVAPRGWVATRVELTTGEGVQGRERNEGKDVGGLVEVRPLAGMGHPERLRLAVYGRDGSRGLSSVRDDRLGARLDVSLDPVSVGIEGLAAWGVAGDATRAPIGGATWVVGHPWGPLLVAGRLDAWTESPGDPDAGVWRATGAAGVRLAVPGLGTTLLTTLVDHTRTGSAVADIAGETALLSSTTLSLQLSTTLGWAHRTPR